MPPPFLRATAVATFVGRNAELAELEQLVSNHGLVSVVGPPGVGKTALCNALAQSSSASLSSIAWADLSNVFSPEELSDAVCRVLGGTPDPRSGDIPNILLSERPIWIVLDGFEHLLPWGAEWVDRWRRTPGSQAAFIVATREPLLLDGEHILDVPPLKVPSSEVTDRAELRHNHAIGLFIQRAAASGVTVSDDQLPAVSQLVRQLDGLPLALELAAVRLRVLSVDSLLGRLNQRLDLLSTHKRDVSERQRSFRATLDWSWELLEPQEQAALAQLSVFRGGFSLRAAEAVIDSTENQLDLVQALTEKSLVFAAEADGPERRFLLLQFVRAYSQERLNEIGGRFATELRHAQYFGERVRERLQSGWMGPGADWSALEADRANLMAVLDRFCPMEAGEIRETSLIQVERGSSIWPIEDNSASVRLAGVGLDGLDQETGNAAKRQRLLDRVMGAVRTDVGDDTVGRAHFLLAKAEVALLQARPDALSLAEEAGRIIELGNDPLVPSRLALLLSAAHLSEGRAAEALSHADRAQQIAYSHADSLLEVAATSARTNALLSLERKDEACAAALGLLERLELRDTTLNLRATETCAAALGRAGRPEDGIGLLRKVLEQEAESASDAWARCMLRSSSLNLDLGRLDRAEALLDDLSLRLGVAHHFGASVAVLRAGCASDRGDLGQARALLEDAVTRSRAKGERQTQVQAQSYLVLCHLRTEAFERAGRVAKSALRLCTEPSTSAWLRAARKLIAVRQGRTGVEDVETKQRTTPKGLLSSAALLANPGSDGDARATALRGMTEAMVVGGEGADYPWGAPSVAARSWVIRQCAAVMSQQLTSQERSDAAALALDHGGKFLLIGASGGKFRPPGEPWLDFEQRPQYAQVVLALVAQRIQNPGSPLSTYELAEKAWPDEYVAAESAANRVAVAINSLRKSGLKGVLCSQRGEGYWLDPDVPLVLADPTVLDY